VRSITHRPLVRSLRRFWPAVSPVSVRRGGMGITPGCRFDPHRV